MRGHSVFSEALRKMMGNAFGEAPSVDENQCGRMLLGEFRDAVVDFAPHFIRGDGAEFAGGNFDGQVEFAAMADVHDLRLRSAATGQEVRDKFDRLLRGGESDARKLSLSKVIEALEREREVRATFIVGNGMDFIDDYGLDSLEDFATLCGGEQDVERFRRCHQNMRRTREHGATL